MVQKKKRIFTLAAVALLICCVWGVIRIHIWESKGQTILFEQENTIVNDGVHTQDNCLLIAEAGGLKTFPFIWSEVLYLYDIETEKRYFVDIAKIPYETYGKCFIIGSALYFFNFVFGETPNIHNKDLKTGKVEQLDISSRSFIAEGDSLLYWDAQEGGSHTLKLYEDGTTRTLISQGVEDITATGTEVYWFKESETTPYEAYEYNLSNQTSSRLNFSMKFIGWIYKVDASEYLFEDEWTLYKWDDDAKRKQALSEPGEVYSDVYFKDTLVYYRKEDQTIAALNPETKSSLTLIDVKDYMKEDSDEGYAVYIDTIDYCKDYIAVFVSTEKGNIAGSALLFFDYEGKYIERV